MTIEVVLEAGASGGGDLDKGGEVWRERSGGI